MNEQLCYLNGTVLPLSEAKVGVLDLGVLRGFGIYEGITSFSGKPFRLTDHWERFQKSAQQLGLTLPYTQAEVEKALLFLIQKNTNNGRAGIRLVLTGGEALEGIEYVPGRENFIITATQLIPLPQELYAHGATLITHEHMRFMPEIKTIHYITAVTLQKKRKEAGAIEILYTYKNQVLECSTSNVFIVKNGVIRTPAENILGGITRKVVLELARGTYPIEENVVLLENLFDADEIFITSSFKDIVPIISVDGRLIGSGVPGPITHDLMERLMQYENSL